MLCFNLLHIHIMFSNPSSYLSRNRRSLRRTSLETVLESSGDVLQVLHSTSTSGLSSLGLSTPVERSSLSRRVATGSTSLLLHVERTTTTSLTQSVGFVMTLTERRSTLTHLYWFVTVLAPSTLLYSTNPSVITWYALSP